MYKTLIKEMDFDGETPSYNEMLSTCTIKEFSQGFIGYSDYSDDVLWVLSLFIKDEFRCSGLGEKVLAIVQAIEGKDLMLGCPSKSRANNFYKRIGFTKFEFDENYNHQEGVNYYIRRKK